MKVLHVLQNSLPSLAGYCIRADALMRAMQAKGVQAVAVTGAAERGSTALEEEISGVKYYRTHATIPAGPAGYREWKLYQALLSRVETVAAAEKPDVIHVHSPAYNAMAAAKVARRRGIPLVYEIRALWEDAAVDRGRLKSSSVLYKGAAALETFVCGKADAVVTICEGLRREVASRGINQQKLFVAPNGVDPERFPPQQKNEALADSLGLCGFPIFAFIGSLFNYEGVEDLLDAAPTLFTQFPAARLLIIGAGEREREVQAKVAALSLPQVVLRGRVSHAEVTRYYSMADCMVYPRRRNRLTETVTPLKPLEAMAMQKGIVASDVGGHRELIRPNVTGLLYAAGDQASLICALSRVASDPDLGARLGAAGRQEVLTNWTWSRSVEGHIAAYKYAGAMMSPGSA
jgi:PEP-CTERM/exosortase A-associated glycosyltransferase